MAKDIYITDTNEFNDLISMCNKQKDGSYIQKTGDLFIDSFKKHIEKKHKKECKNLSLFSIDDIKKQKELCDFSFQGKNDFKLVGKLVGEKMKIDSTNKITYEKIVIKDDKFETGTEYIYKNSKGVVYMITALLDNKEYIIKFGSSRKVLMERINSYNAGKIRNIGTASTANIFILQSIIASNLEFNLYVCDCSDFIERFKWYDKISAPFASSKSLAYENIIIKAFEEQFKCIPIGNTQKDTD